MAGPSIWKLALVGEVGFPTAGVCAQRPSKSDRPRRQRPFLSKMVRSGVNGLVALNDPPTAAVSLLLQLFPAGRPLPDSTTRTWKSFLLPRKAIPVGKLRSLAKTETLKPAGTAMSSPFPGS
jgi:hypothetical protein